ncbi:MAG: hypothetical protein MUP19_00330 [Candidatus Aminicenantes bacterium]|jgi:hypothetical protein|nr:hypothetical protein [Candidatus Aminicenantes bacterium]
MIMAQNLVMIAYYVLSAFLTAVLIRNFVKEKKNLDDVVLILVVLIPLVLRLFRIK